jgi:hypothetical protein
MPPAVKAAQVLSGDDHSVKPSVIDELVIVDTKLLQNSSVGRDTL